MSKPVKFPGNTIALSDTADQWGRKVHINVRGDKVTLVYRWKSRLDNRAHTQRMTLDDTQASRLLASVAIATVVAVGEDKVRGAILERSVGQESERLAKLSEV